MSRVRVAGFVIVLLYSPAAMCQATIVPNCLWNGMACGGHAATGYADLDRAVAICDAHEASTGWVAVPPSPTYRPGYEGCSRVMAKREETEQASREREARAREDADRKFLAGFVERLSGEKK